MTAAEKTTAILRRLNARGIPATFSQAETLRRAELTLQRWAELECGDGNGDASWSIERDEDTGVPYMVFTSYQPYTKVWRTTRSRTPDREAGALKRVQAVCAEMGIHYFHQTDPRGCALYVSQEPLTDSAYTGGVSIC